MGAKLYEEFAVCTNTDLSERLCNSLLLERYKVLRVEALKAKRREKSTEIAEKMKSLGMSMDERITLQGAEDLHNSIEKRYAAMIDEEEYDS